MITAYEASRNSDLTEGRGYKVVVGYFKDPLDAAAAVAQFTYMGGQPAGAVKPVEVYDSLQEYQAARKDKARESALRKLTPEERHAVGL
jgi:hypothetical protein